jgi:hypothetical protein
VNRHLLVSLAAATGACAYEPVGPPRNLTLPAARSPADSLASIAVPACLRGELVAAEPLVMDPIDLAGGSDGRGAPDGRIRVLSSSRGDGHYDRSTLFAEGLNFPNSVLPLA